jgi:hypothetical protein
LIPGHRLAGRVLPARHFGRVDAFLEAMENGKRPMSSSLDGAIEE